MPGDRGAGGFFGRVAIKDNESEVEVLRPPTRPHRDVIEESHTSPKPISSTNWLSAMIVDHRRGSMGFSGIGSPMDDDNSNHNDPGYTRPSISIPKSAFKSSDEASSSPKNKLIGNYLNIRVP